MMQLMTNGDGNFTLSIVQNYVEWLNIADYVGLHR